MATVIIDGKEYEYTVLDGTSSTYSAATQAVDLYTEKYSSLQSSQKVQVKWAMAGGANVVGATITFVQEDDKIKALAKIGGSWVGGVAAVTVTEAVIAFAAGLGATLSAPAVIAIGVTAGVVLSVAGSETSASLYDMVASWFGYGSAESETIEFKKDKNGTTISTDSTEDFNQALKYINHIASKESKVELFGDTTLREYLKIDSTNNTATVNANTQEAKTTIIKDVLYTKTNLVDKIIHDGQTYDIITANTLTPLELRNLMENIGEESYYDPAISIREETKMDLGKYGVLDISYSELTVQYIEQALEEFLEVA